MVRTVRISCGNLRFRITKVAQKVQGRGSKTGDPHFGSHAWPSMCSAILTVVEDNKVDSLLDTLHKMDLQTEQLGLRAFVWNIERTI